MTLPRTVFFDIDGTLSDSAPGLTRGFSYALEKLGIGHYAPEQLLDMVGPPLLETFMERFGLTRERALEAVMAQREYYTGRGIYENRLYEGVPQMLSALADSGVRLAIATSKPDMFARSVLENFRLAGRFAYIGAVPRNRSIPKTEVLSGAVAALGEDPAQCLMVGDRRQDVQAASACGMDCAGALWGYGSRQELAGCRILATSPRDLADQLLRILITEKS